ncbi:thioredoxin domain-containing protein [Patescibacteria group bacterium]|nr:thioredoxin domain-containing protein [Patescibacteria group bacterium]
MNMLTENSHEPVAGGVGPFNGPPKTMFLLGLFAGVASCTTLALVFVVWSIASGRGLALGTGSAALAAAPAAPSAAAPAAQPSAPAAAAGPMKPVDEKVDHIKGPKNAKVTLVEYSDFECPFCKRHFEVMNQVMKQYPNDVRLVFRNYPLSFHQNAMKEAQAAECAAEVGGNDAYWKYHDKIFTETASNGTGFALDRLVPAAKEIGLDEKKFKTCLDSDKYAAKVNQQMQEGSAAGVQGTPGTFVNGTLVEGAVPLSQFTTMIDGILKK